MHFQFFEVYTDLKIGILCYIILYNATSRSGCKPRFDQFGKMTDDNLFLKQTKPFPQQ